MIEITGSSERNAKQTWQLVEFCRYYIAFRYGKYEVKLLEGYVFVRWLAYAQSH